MKFCYLIFDVRMNKERIYKNNNRILLFLRFPNAMVEDSIFTEEKFIIFYFTSLLQSAQ